MRYTISIDEHDGWHGSVTADNPADAFAAAKELTTTLDALRASVAVSAPATPPELTKRGEACLAYCEANPRCTYDEYTSAGHTLNTVKWLQAHGYLHSADMIWTVDRAGKLPVAEPKAKRPKR